MITIHGLTIGHDLIDYGGQVIPNVLQHVFSVWMVGQHLQEKQAQLLQ